MLFKVSIGSLLCLILASWLLCSSFLELLRALREQRKEKERKNFVKKYVDSVPFEDFEIRKQRFHAYAVAKRLGISEKEAWKLICGELSEKRHCA